MPELPEVETTRRGLAPYLVGRKFDTVVIREPRLRWRVDPALAVHLAGARIAALDRRAKYLLARTDRGTLIIHLGMSGSLRIVCSRTPAGPHDHLDFRLDPPLLLRLRDPRRFGAVLWSPHDPELHPLLASLGPEPLGKAFSGRYVHDATRSRRTTIKAVLMDSRFVAGVGNIYANEALFHAGIRPTTAAKWLGPARCDRLARAIRDTLRRSIRAGGSTLRDFVDGFGQPGYFQQEYAVYGRAGLPCQRCGAVVREIRQQQRASFYCPKCQR